MPSEIKRKRSRTEEEGDSVEVEASIVDEEAEEDEMPSAGPSKPATSKTSSKKRKTKGTTPGVVYISRVPPGMTPHKVRHLMARWGDVGRVYAQRKDAPTGYNPNHQNKKKETHKSANFTEAWVEFTSKSVAKTVASMLNAQVIGGKKGDRWRDDVWTMKYLSGFKWEMLGEQVAYERQVHQSRLRAEITRSKAEQGEYLKNVELARVLKKRDEKRAAKGEDDAPKMAKAGGSGETKGKRSYKQREVADRAHGLEAKGMDSVMGSIFG